MGEEREFQASKPPLSWCLLGWGEGRNKHETPFPQPHPHIWAQLLPLQAVGSVGCITQNNFMQSYCNTFYEGRVVPRPPQNPSGALGKSLSGTQLLYAEVNGQHCPIEELCAVKDTSDICAVQCESLSHMWPGDIATWLAKRTELVI